MILVGQTADTSKVHLDPLIEDDFVMIYLQEF